MAKLGFEKVLIAVLDEQGVAVADKTYTFDAEFGGAIEATISNIGAEATKVAASNVDYFISQKG